MENKSSTDKSKFAILMKEGWSTLNRNSNFPKFLSF